MGSVNKVILVGNLGADPEGRYTADGRAVTTMRIATSERFNDKEGNAQERTEWHRIVVWGKQAEHCKEYLAKGRQVYLEGRLQTRDWTDRDGNKRYTTEVVADRVVFLSAGAGGGERRTGGHNRTDSSSREPSSREPSSDGYFSAPSSNQNSPAPAGDGYAPTAGEDDVPF